METRRKIHIHYCITEFDIKICDFFDFFFVIFVRFFYWGTSYILGKSLRMFWHLLRHSLKSCAGWTFRLHYFTPLTLISKLIQKSKIAKKAGILLYWKIFESLQKDCINCSDLQCIAKSHKFSWVTNIAKRRWCDCHHCLNDVKDAFVTQRTWLMHFMIQYHKKLSPYLKKIMALTLLWWCHHLKTHFLNNFW